VCVAFFSSGYLDVSVPQVPVVRSALPQSFRLGTVERPYRVWVRRWEDCGGALLTTTVHYHGRVSPFGYPRIKACLAAPRGLSQPATSFVGVFSQGIHHVRFQCPKNRRTRVLRPSAAIHSENSSRCNCHSLNFQLFKVTLLGATLATRVSQQGAGGKESKNRSRRPEHTTRCGEVQRPFSSWLFREFVMSSRIVRLVSVVVKPLANAPS
jgi:hypothetical protein